ncbi:Mu transposase C-terminal domain-containing protein, partial [Halalkalibacterium halodurans]
LDQFNHLFQAWLSECYQNKPHSALDAASPEAAFRSDSKTLRFPEVDVLANAFLHCEERKVDKAGCISFMGKKYEVGLLFIGRKVQVVYDLADISEVTIEYEGHSPWKARELEIGERAGKRPVLPDHLLIQETDHSRLLQGAEQKLEERKQIQAPAVSYRRVRKEENGYV